MKKVSLTRGKYALVDNDDYDAISRYKWHYNSRGYATRQEYLGKINGRYKQKTVCMHRQILDAPVGYDVDHKNGDRLDNRKNNIRVCTRGQNIMNSTRKGKYTGVSKFINKAKSGWTRYSSRITSNGKCIFLGYYNTPEEAAIAYNKAAKKYHGKFARLNIIREGING